MDDLGDIFLGHRRDPTIPTLEINLAISGHCLQSFSGSAPGRSSRAICDRLEVSIPMLHELGG